MPENYISQLTRIEADLQPRTCVEEILVSDIAANHWRRTRTRQMEKALIDYEIDNFECPPSVDQPVTIAVLACRWAAGQSGIFDLLGRSENRYARNMAASLRLLLQLRAARPNPAAAPRLPAIEIERKDL
jgi:hypothetical protein